MKLDVIDKGILRELQKDCKQTNKALSAKLHLSVTAIYERIRKLEKSGVIRQYVALIDKDKVDLGLLVFCQIKLSKHIQENITSFEKEIVELEEVVECYHLSGAADYLLKIYVRDMDHFREFMVTKLTAIQHIGNNETSFTIHEVKNSTALHLENE